MTSEAREDTCSLARCLFSEMSAADFANAKGERFSVALLGEDGAPTQNVVVQVRWMARESRMRKRMRSRERERNGGHHRWRAEKRNRKKTSTSTSSSSSTLSPNHQVGMDGLFLMSPDASRTLRKFPLSHIARWAIPPSAGGAALVLYTRTPVDVEEVTLTLSGPPPTIRAVLDTLTCCCMQMVELLESERETASAAAEANNNNNSNPSARRRHSSGGFRRRKAPAALPAAEEVEFWHSPEKEGWLQSQGDHIRTWRRRWHVLKQGYLFRFASEKDAVAGPSSRPRGVVDLSKITDVSGAGSSGSTAAMIRLSTPQGASISYLADSETEAVEWVSALESSVARIVRAVAGFGDDDDEEREGDHRSSSSRRNNGGGSGRPSRSSSTHQQHQQQQQLSSSSFDAANSAAAGLAAAGGNPFVSVVGYEGIIGNNAAPAPHSAAHQHNQQYYAPTAPAYGNGSSGVGYDRGGGGEMAGGAVFGGGPTFGGVAGIAGVAASPAAVVAPSPYAGGGGYPAASDHAAATAAAPAAPYASYQQEPQPSAAAAPAPPPVAPTAAPLPPSLPEPWQVHYTSDGRAYFYNSSTNATQWEPPQAASLV